MRRINKYVLGKIRIFIFIAITVMLFYLITRIIMLNYSEYNYIERIFGILLISAEAYIVVHSFGYMLEIFKLSGKEKEEKIKKLDYGSVPSVAILIAAKNEPLDILERTLITVNNIDYPTKSIYILDDSSGKTYKKKLDRLCRKLGVRVFRRKKRHGAKAGIINDFIKTLPEKYIAVIDADQNIMPDFLKKIVPIMESDEKLGFVQTPQFYTNIERNPIAKAAGMQQAIFYENICEGKSLNNAMFCCGTNVLFRRQALVDCGGFDESSITEDFATSVKIHALGSKSLYYNHVFAFGMAPESLPAYFKQQARWATGTTGVFRKLLQYFMKNPKKLSLMQWWEYSLSGTYYFLGWVFLFLLIAPITFLIFNIPSYFLKPEIYIGAFLPYILLSLLIFYSTMAERHYTFSQIYYGSILGLLSFPVLIKSSLYGLFGKKTKFVVTPKGKTEKMPLRSLWPYFLMITLNIIAITLGLIRVMNKENPWALLANMFWATYHLFILSHIFYFNNIPKIDKSKKI